MSDSFLPYSNSQVVMLPLFTTTLYVKNNDVSIQLKVISLLQALRGPTFHIARAHLSVITERWAMRVEVRYGLPLKKYNNK